MLILGVDPGSVATGYGIVESRSGALRPLTHGTIVPPSTLAFLDRLPFIASAIEMLILRVAPDVAAVEDAFHAHNSRVALKLGCIRGATLLPILRARVPVFEYAPRLVKQAVTGSGAADKDQVRRMVRLLLGLGEGPLPLDASDALALAICHSHAAPLHRARDHAARA